MAQHPQELGLLVAPAISAAQVLRGKPRRGGWERNHGILKWFGGWVEEDLKDHPVPTGKRQQIPLLWEVAGEKGDDTITTSPPQHTQSNFITKATFLSHSASPAFKEQAGPGPGLGGSLCSPPRLLVGQSQFWRQQMGSQDGLTRHLKVRHKCQECENLSVREPLAPAALHLSCWCDFPAGKGRLEQSPSLQGHPWQMARHPFGSHLP